MSISLSMILVLLLVVVQGKLASAATTPLAAIELTRQEFFINANGHEDSILKYLVSNKNTPELEKWTEIMGEEHEGLLFSYIFMLALEVEEFKFAYQILKRIRRYKIVKLTPTVPILGTIESYFQEIRLVKKPWNIEEFEWLVGKIDRMTAKKRIPTPLLGDLALSTDNIATCGTGRELTEAASQKHYGHLYMFLMNCKAEMSAEQYDQELAKLKLYEHSGLETLSTHPSETITLFPKIFNKLKVPILVDINARPRSAIYKYTDQIKRTYILNHLKLNGSPNDSKIYSKMYSGNPQSSLYHALTSGKANLVENFFLRTNIGAYESNWILFAIKSSTMECLEILLEERVPLPSEAELADAYKDLPTERVAHLKLTFDSYKEYYNDNDNGICIEGPIGCDSSNPKTEQYSNASSPIEIDPFLTNECDPINENQVTL